MKEIDKIKQLLKSEDDKNIILGLNLLYNTLKWSVDEIVQFCLIEGNIRTIRFDPPTDSRWSFIFVARIDGYFFNIRLQADKYHQHIYKYVENSKNINYKLTSYFIDSDTAESIKEEVYTYLKKIRIKFIKLLLNIDKD